MTADQLVDVVCELYDARKEAKEYLEYWLNPDPEKAFEEAKEEVHKLFFFSSGKIRKAPTATFLKKFMKDFSSMVYDSDKIAQLYLHLAETHYNWAISKKSGFTSVEADVRRSYTNALNFIQLEALEEKYNLRLERLKDHIDKFFKNPPAPQYRRRRRWW